MRIKRGEIVEIHDQLPTNVDYLQAKVTAGIHQGVGKITVETTETMVVTIPAGSKFNVWCENVERVS